MKFLFVYRRSSFIGIDFVYTPIMKTTLFQVILFSLFLLECTLAIGQTQSSINDNPLFNRVHLKNSKLILNANGGINYYGHMPFKEQAYEWNSFPNQGAEFGFEAFYIHKKGLALKAAVFNGLKSGGGDYSSDFFTDQEFRGYSIGLGKVSYVSLEFKDGKPVTFIGIFSLSFGSSHSALWLDGSDQTFGNLEINGNEKKFFIDNYFVDFNLNGTLMNLQKANSNRERRLFFLTGIQLGALVGIHRSNWVRDSTQEYVEGVSRTLPYSFYVKWQIGIGGNLNRW